MADALKSHMKSYRKSKLNDFVESCGLSPISEADMDLSSASERSRRRYIAETREVVVIAESCCGLVGGTDNLKQDARSL